MQRMAMGILIHKHVCKVKYYLIRIILFPSTISIPRELSIVGLAHLNKLSKHFGTIVRCYIWAYHNYHQFL
jgi:hypothetical protein